MPVFGLLAGAVHGWSRKQGWALVQNKAARLLLPMLSVGTLFALVQYAIPGSNVRIEDLQLMHIVPVAHYWFLESLFLIFCGMAVAESLLPISSTLRWCVYFAASLLLYLAHPGVIWFSVLGATYLLPYFLLGLGLTRLRWDVQQQRRQTGLLLIVPGASLVLWLLQQGPELDRFSAPVLLAGLLLSAGLWSLGWRNALLARIGHYSFFIFLFHAFFTAATRMALQALLPDALWLVLLVSVPVGVLAPAALQRLFARSPRCSRWLLGMPQVPATPQLQNASQLHGAAT
jgi:fucose 4-O-acetylase-like acetyltransferase